MGRADEARPARAAGGDAASRPPGAAGRRRRARRGASASGPRSRRTPRRLVAGAAARGRDAADEGPEGDGRARVAGVDGREDDTTRASSCRAPTGLPGLAAEADVDLAGREAHVGAGDDVAPARAAEQVIDGAGPPSGPREIATHGPRGGKAHLEPRALVGSPARREAASAEAAATATTKTASRRHSGLRNQSIESADAARARTPPSPAKAAVTSRSSLRWPIREPSSR